MKNLSHLIKQIAPAFVGAYFLHFKFYKMSAYENCKSLCIEFLESRSLGWVFDEGEFKRQFKGCSLLNAVTVALQISDNLIFSAHNKIN